MSSTPTPAATTESEERSAAIRCLFPSDSSQDSADGEVADDSQIENDGSQSAAAETVTVVEPISPQPDVLPSDSEKTIDYELLQKTTTADPAVYTPEHSPSSENGDSVLDTSAGSQAIEEMDDTQDRNVMEHDEFKELIVSRAEQRRIVRNSTRPTLWRHQRRPMASLCLFDAVDDGVCLAMTGLLWSIDNRMYEIVLVCTLGWAAPRKKKSHQIGVNQPIYVLIRDASKQGSAVKFEQLLRCLASVLFREGRPHSDVNFQDIASAKKIVETFTEKNARDYDAWGGIHYLYTRHEIEQRRREEAEAAARLQQKRDEAARKRQARIERMSKKRELAELKRQEREARIAAEKARNKTEKAVKERRKREIASVVRVVVTKACKKLEAELHEQFAKSIETSRAEIEADLGHRLSQVEEAVESNMVHRETFSNHKTHVDKRFKKLLVKVKKLGEDAEKISCVDEENDVVPRKRVKKARGGYRRPEALQSLSNYRPAEMSMAMMSPEITMPASTLHVTARGMHPDVWGSQRLHPMTHAAGHTPYASSIFGQRTYNR